MEEMTSCRTEEIYDSCTDEQLSCVAHVVVMDQEMSCNCMNFGDNSECDQLIAAMSQEINDHTPHAHDHLWEETEDNKPLWALSHYDQTVYTLHDHLEEAVADETVTTPLEERLEYMLEDE